MRRTLRSLVLLAILALVAGCTGTKPLPVEVRTRTYEADPSAVYGTVIDMLVAKGYVVAVAERESGIITSGWKDTAGALQAAFAGDQRRRISARLAESGTGTRLTLNYTVQGQVYGNWNTFRQDGSIYDALFADVEQYLTEWHPLQAPKHR